MGRVLLPSDQRDWVTNFVSGYRLLGWDVTTGLHNFDLEASSYDVVHLNWPEELTGWKVPKTASLDAAISRLDRWAGRARIIASVNNLYPHGQRRDPVWRRLYLATYERAEVIHHFSHASKEAVCAEYPEIADRNHVVTVGFNYDVLLPTGERDRMASRKALGLKPEETVFLCFGSLRYWSEVQLIRDAFASARVARKRLLMAARYVEGGTSAMARMRRWRWMMWQSRHKVISLREYVPEAEVFRLFDAADAVVVIRQNSISSGVPSLAMTFGRFVIAPDSGAMREYLSDSGNLLYDPTSSASLAAAIERAKVTDREAVGVANRQIAAKWAWEMIVKDCLGALPPKAA